MTTPSTVGDRHRPRPLTEVAALYPGARGAKTSHPATWTRWILKGAVGVDGVRRRLKATRFGCRWLVTPADADAFFAALAASPSGPGSVPPQPTPSDRRKAAEAAVRELAAAGA